MANSHKNVVAADAHAPATHATSHNVGGSDATSANPQVTTIELGHATDTTIARASAGNVTVEGNALYRAGGTDVAVADGGTGASTATAGFDALSPMTTAGDLILGGASGTRTRLAIGTSTHVLTSNGTTAAWAAAAGGGGTAGTTILLTYDLAADISNQALTAGTYFDMFANQNFTVASATSIVEVAVRGSCFCNTAVANNYNVRINIDSAGTPIYRYFGGAQNVSVVANTRNNPINGGSVFLSGLTAATHTIKVQFVATAQNDSLYCRASTAGPPTNGAEFLSVQVIEHLI